jgi:hypothetical protein
LNGGRLKKANTETPRRRGDFPLAGGIFGATK